MRRTARSLDDFFGQQYQGLRDFHAERSRRLKIDRQLELRGLLDWELGRRCSAENLVDIVRGLPIEVIQIRPVAHQQTCLRKLFRVRDSGQVVFDRRVRDLLAKQISQRADND